MTRHYQKTRKKSTVKIRENHWNIRNFYAFSLARTPQSILNGATRTQARKLVPRILGMAENERENPGKEITTKGVW